LWRRKLAPPTGKVKGQRTARLTRRRFNSFNSPVFDGLFYV
jgi:hypothetical protein